MTFDSLARRCIMEQEWTLPDRDDPRRAEVQREIDEYYKEVGKLFITLPSGAKFWGSLAITPITNRRSAPETLTREQVRDYGLPDGNYRFIGRGSESVVYTNGIKVYKISKTSGTSRSFLGGESVYIEGPEDVLESRYEKCRESKKVDSFPPIKLGDTFKFYMSLWQYTKLKERGETIDFPEGVVYHEPSEGFTFTKLYSFDSLNIKCMDNGIIIQDIIPEDHRDLTYDEKIIIANHMTANGVTPDMFNMGNNIKIGRDNIYIMD